MLYESRKTDSGVLPQPRTLESMPADTPGVGTKRGMEAAARVGATVVQPGRGESRREAAVAPQGAGREATNTTVFVLDRHKRPLMPTTERRARKLLKQGRAVVHRGFPFTIRIKDRTVAESQVEGLVLGIDPGSRHTGLSLARHSESIDAATGEVTQVRTGVWLGELVHRGLAIKKAMVARASLRRGRRSRNLRYRAPRFNNRTRPDGWLPPSLQHRVDTTASWVDRLRRWAPVVGIEFEATRFDTRLMHDPNVIDYTVSERGGFEVREYLLEKYQRTCVYCDATQTVLNIDHVVPRAHGGSDRISNLVTACVPCNERKSAQPVEEFLAHDPARLARVKRGLKAPLRDAAATQSVRNATLRKLRATDLPVAEPTGGNTKYNRTRLGVPKAHALDALVLGEVTEVTGWPASTHVIGCTGRGGYRRTLTDRYGFPRGHKSRRKQHFGFATGDMVRAHVPTGKKAGTHAGRVAVRATGSFKVGTVDGINHKHITLTQRGDGYMHHHTNTPKEVTALPPLPHGRGLRAGIG